MGSIRGIKKRKKADNKDGQDASATPFDWWHHFSLRISGPLAQSKNIEKFESVFKISRKTFNYICFLVGEDLLARASNFVDLNGKRLSLNDQVAIALRRLSSGESLSTIGDSFRMNQSTVSQVTWKFVEAMEERGLHHLSWPSTETEMEEIKSKFEKIKGLYNCCGAIDSTHIMMTLPSVDALNSVWLDRDKNCSMVLQAIVDPDLRFRDIVTGWPGSKGLSNVQVEFNKRVVETQMLAKKALARLKEMWRIIQGVMWKSDKHKLPRIILVCCILHNIVIDMEDEVLDAMPSCHQHDSRYQDQTCEFVDNTANTVREKLSLYLSGKLDT
ncbi:hypothetical protein ACSQ67_013500 [Phaseolus vulgaris]